MFLFSDEQPFRMLRYKYRIINKCSSFILNYPTNTTSGQIGECIPRDKHTDLIPLLRYRYVDIHRCQ